MAASPTTPGTHCFYFKHGKKVYKYTLDNFVLNWIDMGIIAIFSVYGAFIGKNPTEVFRFAYFKVI